MCSVLRASQILLYRGRTDWLGLQVLDRSPDHWTRCVPADVQRADEVRSFSPYLIDTCLTRQYVALPTSSSATPKSPSSNISTATYPTPPTRPLRPPPLSVHSYSPLYQPSSRTSMTFRDRRTGGTQRRFRRSCWCSTASVAWDLDPMKGRWR
jgi:hypothetical protein